MAAEPSAPLEVSDAVIDCINHLFHGFGVHEDRDAIRAMLVQLHEGPLKAKIIENVPVSNLNIRAASARLTAARGLPPVPEGQNNSVARFRSQAPTAGNKTHFYSTRRSRTLGGVTVPNISGYTLSGYIPVFYEFMSKRLLNASITATAATVNSVYPSYIFRSNTTDKYKNLQDTLTHISGGTYGKVYKGHSNFIYKEMHKKDSKDIESFCRSVFLEAFINIVLQNDPTYGAHVGRLIKILKHPDFNDLDNPVHTIYFILEPIKFTLLDYFQKGIEEIDKRSMERELLIYPVFYSLGAILEHFDRVYGFRHGDLHVGNIMLTPYGKIKLIDFGFSCIRGYTPTPKQPCEGYDLLQLIFNMYAHSPSKISGIEIMKPIMDTILSTPRGNNIHTLLYTLYTTHTKSKKFTWHLSYPIYMNNPTTGWGLTMEQISKYGITGNVHPSVLPLTVKEWFEMTRIAGNLQPKAFKHFWLLPGEQRDYALEVFTYPSPCGTGPLEFIEVNTSRGRSTTRRNRNNGAGANRRARSRSRS